MSNMGKGKEIFVLRVTIGAVVDQIIVHEDDEPFVLASLFGRKHGLDRSSVLALEKEVELNIKDFIETQEPTFLSKDTFGSPNDYLEKSTESLSKLRTMGTLKMSSYKTPDNSLHYPNNTGSSNPFSPSKSRTLLDKTKLYRFQTLFRSLHPDKNGKVSAKTISKLNSSHKVYRILAPVINHIVNKNSFMNYREFCTQMELLFNHLCTEDKYYILSPNLKTISGFVPNRHRSKTPMNFRF
jgi:hypothetical protein